MNQSTSNASHMHMEVKQELIDLMEFLHSDHHHYPWWVSVLERCFTFSCFKKCLEITKSGYKNAQKYDCIFCELFYDVTNHKCGKLCPFYSELPSCNVVMDSIWSGLQKSELDTIKSIREHELISRLYTRIRKKLIDQATGSKPGDVWHVRSEFPPGYNTSYSFHEVIKMILEKISSMKFISLEHETSSPKHIYIASPLSKYTSWYSSRGEDGNEIWTTIGEWIDVPSRKE